ncbi:hypothetical protein JD844_005981 [Phrynosoma platyrhinos]|uniref:Alpha-ketoglutarate-dependent dioxygenase AlkB-like domain-containing protein n=1 Tax=Phrynosoma platyrhinos TaxID=52577 RepID=A0ABQ7TQZ2_PHRPL|nr:hypothetical protein JD844_005981 [Phrynosoma platyrhinos]
MSESCRNILELEVFRVEESPPAAYYIPNFISEGEEAYLLQQVYGAPKPKWTQLSGRRLQNWGNVCMCLGVYERQRAWFCAAFSQEPALQTEEQRHFLSLLLKPRSLLVLREDMYVRYLHGIRFITEDTVTKKVVNAALCGSQPGDRLQRGTRVSLTIRHVPKVLKTSIILGKRK